VVVPPDGHAVAQNVPMTTNPAINPSMATSEHDTGQSHGLVPLRRWVPSIPLPSPYNERLDRVTLSPLGARIKP